MSRYDATRAAITTAIKAADPTAKVDDRWRFPKGTTYTDALNLWGVGDKIRAWRFTRIGEPQVANLEDTGGPIPIVSTQETWQIQAFRSQTPDQTSEYDFQNTVDAVKSQLFSHSAIRQLIPGYQMAVDSVRIDTIGEQTFEGERYVHSAILTLIFTIPRTLP